MTHTDETAQIIGELRAFGEESCTCRRLGNPLGDHAYHCPSRQVGIRLDRLHALMRPSPTEDGPR